MDCEYMWWGVPHLSRSLKRVSIIAVASEVCQKNELTLGQLLQPGPGHEESWGQATTATAYRLLQVTCGEKKCAWLWGHEMLWLLITAAKLTYLLGRRRVGISLSHEKEWSLAICDNMDGPRGYYAKWNKSNRERQILLWFHLYVKSKQNEQISSVQSLSRVRLFVPLYFIQKVDSVSCSVVSDSLWPPEP